MNGFFNEHFEVKYLREGSAGMEFSKRLKKLRENRGLSQEKLAEELNIPRSTITNYETRDDLIPRQKRLNEIADYFGVSVDYLIGRANGNELTKIEDAFLEDMETLSLEEIIAKHTPKLDGKPATKEEVKAAIAFIRSLRSMR
jgi:transcriptional regulator with XRE-family HTH domain